MGGQGAEARGAPPAAGRGMAGKVSECIILKTARDRAQPCSLLGVDIYVIACGSQWYAFLTLEPIRHVISGACSRPASTASAAMFARGAL